MTIGERIREKRLEKHLSLEDVAKKSKVSRQTMQRYEAGIIKNIPPERIEAIAKALDVTPSYIMGWEVTTKERKNKMKIEFEIDEKEIEQLVKEIVAEKLSELILDKRYSNDNVIYRRMLKEATREIIYNDKKELEDRVVAQAAREIKGKALKKIIENITD